MTPRPMKPATLKALADPVGHVLARSRVDAASGCRHWQLRLTTAGTPQIRCAGVTHSTRRWLMETIAQGPMPKGSKVVVKCLTPDCVAPHHLVRLSSRQFTRWLAKHYTDPADRSEWSQRGAATRFANGQAAAAQVRQMAADGMPAEDIARALGRCVSGVKHILAGRRWADGRASLLLTAAEAGRQAAPAPGRVKAPASVWQLAKAGRRGARP